MKTLTTILMLFSFQTFSQTLNIVSYNIRLDTASDGINAWPNRKEMVPALLRFHEADIFGLQEALHHQVADIAQRMTDYAWFGTGRDDGKAAGEFMAVFYHTGKFDLIEDGQFWLSESPEKPGMGWDAACNRVCTWGKFRTKETGKMFYLFNTHFDHVGVKARAESALLIIKKMKQITGSSNLPVILTGDLNLVPESEPVNLLKEYLDDSYEMTLQPPYGPTGTFNGFNRNHPLDRRIDYIFINQHVEVIKYGALTDSWDNRYPSDHLPVLVKVRLK